MTRPAGFLIDSYPAGFVIKGFDMKGYSICFNEWALDKDIKNELGLLCIISSLCAKDGYCYATNEYFAGLFDTSVSAISKKIKL